MKQLLIASRLFFLKKEEFGYTLAELITTSGISIAVLMAGYSLFRNLISINKADQVNLVLSGKVENALDYLIDEINSGNRIITKTSQFPVNCKYPKDEFIIGIKLPVQSLNLGAYSSNSAQGNSWEKVDCPIAYFLKVNTKNNSIKINYNLIRIGPNIDYKGYYIANKVSSTIILDQVRSSPLNNMSCSAGWDKKSVRGIVICTDKLRRGAEIGISAEQRKSGDKYASIYRTSAGYTRISDDDLMGKSSSSLGAFFLGARFGENLSTGEIAQANNASCKEIP
tara:strand:+ start:666 stop:1511 length:846 start_codon:yes stop_codon:yes gene_type:complete